MIIQTVVACVHLSRIGSSSARHRLLIAMCWQYMNKALLLASLLSQSGVQIL